MKQKFAAVDMRGVNAVRIGLGARHVHDHQRRDRIAPCGIGVSAMVLWPSNKTSADVERDAFMAGQSGVVDLIDRYKAELMDGTLSAAEAAALDKQLEAAIVRADALEEAVGHVVAALRAAGHLSKTQASALAAVLVDAVLEPESEMKLRIDLACGLRA